MIEEWLKTRPPPPPPPVQPSADNSGVDMTKTGRVLLIVFAFLPDNALP